jgi:hypothetical protein
MEVVIMLTWIESLYRTCVDFFSGLVLWIKHAWYEITTFINTPHVFLNWLWTWAQDLFWYIGNTIISWVSQASIMAISIIPGFGLQDINTENYMPSRILSALNWVLPFNVLTQAVGILVLSTMAWATVGIVLRWLKINA